MHTHTYYKTTRKKTDWSVEKVLGPLLRGFLLLRAREHKHCSQFRDASEEFLQQAFAHEARGTGDEDVFVRIEVGDGGKGRLAQFRHDCVRHTVHCI